MCFGLRRASTRPQIAAHDMQTIVRARSDGNKDEVRRVEKGHCRYQRCRTCGTLPHKLGPNQPVERRESDRRAVAERPLCEL